MKYGLKGRTPGNVWPRQELQEVWLHPHPGLKKDILSKRSSRLNMFSVLDSTPTIANEEEESRKSVESFPPMGGVHCVLLCETGLCFFVVFLSVRPDTCQACGQRYVETTERQPTGNGRKADFRMVVLASD